MTTPKKKVKHWIEDAIQKAGSFSEDAKRHNKTTAAFARKEQNVPGKLGRRARLAETLMAMRKKKD